MLLPSRIPRLPIERIEVIEQWEPLTYPEIIELLNVQSQTTPGDALWEAADFLATETTVKEGQLCWEDPETQEMIFVVINKPGDQPFFLQYIWPKEGVLVCESDDEMLDEYTVTLYRMNPDALWGARDVLEAINPPNQSSIPLQREPEVPDGV